MSQFDQMIATRGIPIMRRLFGDEAIYTRKNGAVISTWVMLATDLGFAGQRDIRPETVRSVELPVADLLTDPQPGDQVTFKAQTYRVDQLLDNDGEFYRVAIR